jgi:hypothetical protein
MERIYASTKRRSPFAKRMNATIRCNGKSEEVHKDFEEGKTEGVFRESSGIFLVIRVW